MGDAGVAEEIPVLPVDRALVADRERRQHAGRAPVGDARLDRIAHALAHSLDDEAGLRIEQLGRCAAHIAGCAHALLEQVQLMVEAMRVQVAVRLAQAHRKAPALPGAQGALRLAEGGVLVEALVPAEGDTRRHDDRRTAEQRRLDLEAKAQPRSALLRQAGHGADDDQVAAFERRRQAIVHAKRGAPTRCPGAA